MTGVSDVNLIALFVQGGFAVAFFWLVIDTRREAARRESRLLNIIECYNESLQHIADQVGIKIGGRRKYDLNESASSSGEEP